MSPLGSLNEHLEAHRKLDDSYTYRSKGRSVEIHCLSFKSSLYWDFGNSSVLEATSDGAEDMEDIARGLVR
jgi:hypothetical protein